MPRLCSAAPAPASSVTVVAPPVSATVVGLAVSDTVPSRSPRLKSVVEKVALSALAAAAVSETRTPRDARVETVAGDLRLLVFSVRSVTRLLPTRPLSVERLPSLTVKLRAVSDLPPAEKRSPPEWLIVPRAVARVERAAGDREATPPRRCDRSTRTPARSAPSRPGVELERGGPARERVVRRCGGGCGGKQQRAAAATIKVRFKESSVDVVAHPYESDAPIG